MDPKKIVRVDASFEQGRSLFEWMKRYATASDGHYVYWGEYAFTTNPLNDCDAVLVFNTPSERIETDCFPETVIAFMMEPGVPSEHPWMFKKLEQYARVYSPLKNTGNTIQSPGFLGWHVMRDWQQLNNLALPVKPMAISCIASALTQFKGHRRRLDFVEQLKKEIPSIDFFGKGSRFIPDKADGLFPYRYSVAIENTSIPFYFTEKITDCFLCYTIPFYYGCKNIGRFFPERSFIHINIEEPAKAIARIRDILENDDWNNRLPALQEARELVLNKYQPLVAAASALSEIRPSVKRKIILEPVPPTLLRMAKDLFHKMKRKK